MQSNAMKLISGALKTTPRTALQQYMQNLSIKCEIEKQSVTSFVAPLWKASWIRKINQNQPLRTQETPVIAHRWILRELNIPGKVEPIGDTPNLLDYTLVLINLSPRQSY